MTTFRDLGVMPEICDALESKGIRVGRTPTQTAEIAMEILGAPVA